MTADLFADPALAPAHRPLTVFRAQLTGCEETSWEEFFAGFEALKAITFSSSLDFLVRLVPWFEDVEIVLGSERILSKDHLALAQASRIVESYGFADALADQKALVEGLRHLLGRSGQALLDRVAAGTLRFRLLRHTRKPVQRQHCAALPGPNAEFRP